MGGMGVVCFAAVCALSFGAALVPRLLPLGLGQRLMASAVRLITRSTTSFSLGVAFMSAGHAEVLQGVAKTRGPTEPTSQAEATYTKSAIGFAKIDPRGPRKPP